MGNEKNKDKLAQKEKNRKQKEREKNLKYSSPKGVRKRKIKRGIITVIVVIILAAIVTGIVLCSTGYAHRHITAFTVDGENFTVADYNYWFQAISTQMMNSIYANADRATVIQNATSIISVAKAAQKMGMELSDDELEQYESTIASIRSDCEGYAGGAQAFYNSTYGFATNEETIRKNYEYQLLAVKYHNEYTSSLNLTHSDLEDYYSSEGYKELDKADFRYCIFTPDINGTLGIDYGSSKAAYEAAVKFNSSLDSTEESFKNAVYSALNEADISTDEFDYDASTLQEDLTAIQMNDELSEIREWSFSKDRVYGDHEVFKANVNGNELSYVIFIVSPAERETYNTVDMRHILIKSTDEESELSAEELIANAKAKIEEINAEWENTDKTDNTFSSLAKKYSEDTTAESGGLIERIYKQQLVQSIDDWLFDSARKEGDYAILESTYGYHLVYFKGTNVEKWEIDAEQYLTENLFEKQSEKIISEYAITSSSNGFVLNLFADESAQF